MPPTGGKVRSFSVPAGTVLPSGHVITADESRAVSQTFTYSPSELTPSQAQKVAIRNAAAAIYQQLGEVVPQSRLQAATKAINAPTGRARGGRIPESAKTLGFKTVAGIPTLAGKISHAGQGMTSYSLGSVRGKPLQNGYQRMDALVRDIFRRNPRARIRVQAYGFPDERGNQSPKRRKKNHPLGFWKKGDVIRGARQWGSTSQIGSLSEWERLAGTPDRFTFGPSARPDASGAHGGTEIDSERMYRVDITVRES